ncbi:hypothetical protein ASG97_11825 [Bacillus sp. Soil745]|nr:hypothetical protein ASG97_11825 [Bacillus sp. Soil745]
MEDKQFFVSSWFGLIHSEAPFVRSLQYALKAGKACLGETPQAQAEEAPRPPAESECLEWKSTFQLYKPSKNCRQNQLLSNCSIV